MTVRPRLPDGLGLWAPCFAVVLGAHLGAAAFAFAPGREPLEGYANDVVTIDMMPDLSTDAEKPDQVAGPEVVESTASTSTMQADEPEPPAPDSPPPTVAEEKKVESTELTAPPAPTPSDAVLAPPTETKTAEFKPEASPVEAPKEDAEKAEETRQTVASRASQGSAGLLGGGKRPSAAAQASWRGEIGQHLVKFRRYPAEARDARQQGIARVKVTIDGNGHVLSRDLAQSSGFPLLDREALEMMTRSDPFPKPPPGYPAPVVLNVPVNFAIR